MQGDYHFRSGKSFVVVEIKGTSQVGRPAVMPAPAHAPPAPARVEQEFTRCYEQQMGPLVRHLMRQGAAPHEAAEAAQAAFTEAYAQWQAITHPTAWLRSVAYRQYLRRPAREDPVADVPDLPGGVCPLAAVELKEEDARVLAALAELPPLQRQVMAWVLDGFPTAEISTALGMTEAAVRQNLCRARARLKQHLLGEHDGGPQ